MSVPKGVRLSIKSEFKKGLIPWNKVPRINKKCIICNNNFFVIKSRNSAKFCNKKCFGLWISKINSGINNPKWIKDRTKIKKSERKDLDCEYVLWARNIKKRDNWKCKLLNSDCSGRLESHHIYSWRDNPELRYVINNGITLCAFHHPRKYEEEKRMIPIFQELLSVSKE